MSNRGAILEVQTGMKDATGMRDANVPVKALPAVTSGKGKFSSEAEKLALRVLVVDDESLIRWSISESLLEIGCEVAQASDAASALGAVTTAARPFDVAVLDFHLPDMSDLSLLATMRRSLPGATLVMMTAFSTPEIVAGANALGAIVINKPFELDDLKRLVMQHGRT